MPEHEHTWREIGRCNHPHASGSNEHRLHVCTEPSCGRFAHSRSPVTYACGRQRRKGPVPPADCPVGLDHTPGERDSLVERYETKHREYLAAVARAQRN